MRPEYAIFEKEILNMRPEYAIFGKVDPQMVEEEIQIAATKVRWTVMNSSEGETKEGEKEVIKEEIRTNEDDKETISEEEMNLIDAKARQTVDTEAGTIDMSKKRATDLKNNRRVMMPGPMTAREEGIMNSRIEMWRETTEEYRKENCRKDGSVKECNLTLLQSTGLKMLQKRVKAGEIVVSEADKGKLLTVCSVDSYRRQGIVHIGTDRKVGWKETRRLRS